GRGSPPPSATRSQVRRVRRASDGDAPHRLRDVLWARGRRGGSFRGPGHHVLGCLIRVRDRQPPASTCTAAASGGSAAPPCLSACVSTWHRTCFSPDRPCENGGPGASRPSTPPNRSSRHQVENPS